LCAAFGKQSVRAVNAKASSLKAVHADRGGETLSFASLFGILDIVDTDGLANPRGLALKFRLSNGGEARS
jgi:hypothetical protein